jgi:hypothetical protein
MPLHSLSYHITHHRIHLIFIMRVINACHPVIHIVSYHSIDMINHTSTALRSATSAIAALLLFAHLLRIYYSICKTVTTLFYIAKPNVCFVCLLNCQEQNSNHLYGFQ